MDKRTGELLELHTPVLPYCLNLGYEKIMYYSEEQYKEADEEKFCFQLNNLKPMVRKNTEDQVVYLMKNSLELYKIGISNNPERRAVQVSASSGLKVQLVDTFKSKAPRKLEQYLHNKLSRLRQSGEWFIDDGFMWQTVNNLVWQYKEDNEKSC